MKKKTLTTTFLSELSTELAMLLDAGLTVIDCMDAMIEDESGGETTALYREINKALENGDTFSEALRSTGVFPAYMLNMLEAGERTGRLVQTLYALAEHYNRQEQLARTIKSAVLYPAILLALMVCVVLILIVQVLPIFGDVFNRLGTQMSPLALQLVQFGEWLGDVSVVLALIVVAVFALVLILVLVPGFRKSIASFARNKWGGHGVLRDISSSRFTSSMSLAMASGLPIAEAVEISSKISGGSKAIEKKHQKCLDMIYSGSTLSDAMRKTGLLSPQEGKLLSIGGRGGKSEEAMAEIARRNESKAQNEIERLVSRIEPMLVIISSVIVGIILLSVMLPLMGIMTTIG